MKNLVLILMIVVMFISCKKETAKLTETFTLSGKWNWISSSGGIAGATNTPASTGNRIIVEFTNDSIYRSYRNGVLFFENKYHLIKSTHLIYQGSDSLIKIDGLPILESYAIKSDTLILYDQCFDCFESYHKRIK